MTIEWRGQSCFEIRGIADKSSILTEFPSRESGLSAPRTKTDIYLSIWSDLEDTLFSNEIEKRFLISSPGEYEIKDVFITGIRLSSDKGALKSAYLISMEDMKIGYLGEAEKKDISPEIIGFFEGVDILILPVGGNEVLNADQAVETINQIEPKIIIPSCYKIPGLKKKADELKAFLKEMGTEDTILENKLLIKKKDINFEGMRVIPLKPI